MRSREDLRKTLLRIDGRGYKAYKDIEGQYDFGSFRLSIDHVQGDPFASPSRVRALVDLEKSRIPTSFLRNRTRQVALRDYLTRVFDKRLRTLVKGHRGMGTSGVISIDRGGQEVLDRTAVVIEGSTVEARFVVGLPAAGRTILGRESLEIFFDEIPRVVEASLFAGSLSLSEMENHVATVEDQESLRNRL
ncbi:MAG: ATPase, partial [Deltaproteobacteria bacterium]|nr:ATPase [Deltaproteobacteria bacterium]